jgi:YfiH family protein
MIRQEGSGIPFYRFRAFEAHDEIVHAVFTRLGGVSHPPYWALNVGNSVGDTPQAVEENHRLVFQTMGVSDARVVTARQVHGNHVGVVDARDQGEVVAETDALITKDSEVNLFLRFADCLPIFLYDPRRGVIGLGHAGWRGTAAMLASQMVSTMIDSFGSDPSDVLAGLGPAIGPCCYEVGPDVAQAIQPAVQRSQSAMQPSGDGRFSLDLWEANRQQLRHRGIQQIEVGRICTSCRADVFFSHRADKGTTGRFAALMGIRNSL